MAKTKSSGSGKRFGPRYGRRNRERVSTLETSARKKHVCPNCNYEKVKRQAAGIWACKKCGHKFASKAYTVAKPIALRQAIEEDF